MARSFSSSSNTDLSVSSGTPYVLGSGMSMACWVKPSSAASQHFFAYGPTSGYGYRLFTVVSGSSNHFHWKPGDNINATISASSYAFGNWHFVGGTTNNSNDHHLYVDTAESSTTWSVSPNTPVLLTIGQSNRYSSGNFDGDVAECAIWDEQLTATEMGMLAAGVSPLMVRPANLVFYCPCNHGEATTDNEIDIVGGLTLTQTNSPGVVAHPTGLYYPASPRIAFRSGVAPPPATIDLSTINGGVHNQLLTIQKDPSALSDIVVKHGTGNLYLKGEADVTLDSTLKRVQLMYDADNSKWVEI